MRVIDFKKFMSGDVIRLANDRSYAYVKWANGESAKLNRWDLDRRVGTSPLTKRRYRFYSDGKEL